MSQFSNWKESYRQDPDSFREVQKSEKVFVFDRAVVSMQKLQSSMSRYDLEDWFGEQLGQHLWEKFISGNNRNLLSWFNSLNNEYRFFITTKLNNDSRFL